MMPARPRVLALGAERVIGHSPRQRFERADSRSADRRRRACGLSVAMAEFDDKYIDPSKRLECRYYEPQYPEIEELVMVNVRNIAEMGAYVTLLEYNNIEGMILLSELSRRRIRSINKLIRVNRNEVVMVLRVDKKNGYIDLSKRRVSPEDVRAPTRETRLAGTRLV